MVEIGETLDNQVDSSPADVVEILEASSGLRALKVWKGYFVVYDIFSGVAEYFLLFADVRGRSRTRLALEASEYAYEGYN